MGIDLHFAVSAPGARTGGFVSNCVLGADVVGDRAADGVDLVEGLRQESDASCFFAHDLQGALGVADVVFTFQDADRIDGRTVFGLKAADGLLSVSVLSLSSPSVTMKITFFSSLASCFRWLAEATTAS